MKPTTIDPVLLPWLQAADEKQAETLLAQLLTEYASPVIQNIIGFKLHMVAQPALTHLSGEDMNSETMLRLIKRLHQFKQGVDKHGLAKHECAQQPINDFRSYAAVLAHHVCAEYLRRAAPQRWRLQDQLRYVLTRQPGLALWKNGKRDWLSGFAAWREEQRHALTPSQLEHLAVGLPVHHPRAQSRAGTISSNLTDLLIAVFKHLGGPIEFPSLVKLVARLRGIKDEVALPWDQQLEQQETSAALPHFQSIMDDQIEQRLYLQWLWHEIQQLPLPNRTALLLNLRDAEENGLIVLLADLQIVTLAQLAEALALTPEQFVVLWNQLPLDDARIALHLGVTRQQVINLRKAARRWLVRRIKVIEENA